MKKNQLRLVWIIPNIFCYLMFVCISIFVLINAEGIIEIGKMSFWLTALLLTFLVSVFGSLRIIYWIKNGKL